MTPTTVLIWTVLPSAILTSVRIPAAGEGISASTLSVEISNRGSSRCTVSPCFFSHLVMVPSKIDSPIWGMITSVGMDSLSLRELPILEQSSGHRRAGRQQILEPFEPHHLAAEDPAKMPDHGVGHLLQRRRSFRLRFHAGDAPIVDATGHNQPEVVEVSGYIEGKAVSGNPARHMHAQGGNLLFCDGSSGHSPHSGPPGGALGKHTVVRTGANE